MSLDGVTVNIIRRARNTKPASVIHSLELRYVFFHNDLNALDKLIWAMLACISVKDESLCCTITLGLIAMFLRVSKDEVLDSLLYLKDKEFLRLGFDMQLKEIADIKPFLRNGLPRPEGFISQIQDVHCQLLLPRLGLVDLLPSSVPPSNVALRC